MIHATTIMSSMSQDQYQHCSRITRSGSAWSRYRRDCFVYYHWTEIIELSTEMYNQNYISEENSKFSLITTSRNLKTLPNDSQLQSLVLDPRLRNPGRLRSVRYYRNFLVSWPYVPPKYSRCGDFPIRDTRENIERIPRSHELNST